MRYGADVQVLASYFSGEQSDDASLDLLKHIALAWASAKRLQDQGVDLNLKGQPLVLSTLEKAYREALHVRSTRVPNETLDVSKLTKLGRING